jgi:sirohydrochlorin cobaltochelatase
MARFRRWRDDAITAAGGPSSRITMNTPPGPSGVILFAHGARDPSWGEPFRRIAVRLRSEAPDVLLELAFLEFMKPDLPDAAAALARRGARHIEIVPLFLGPGGHLNRELPRLAAAIADAWPDITVAIAPAAGEDDGVIDALGAYALRRAGMR